MNGASIFYDPGNLIYLCLFIMQMQPIKTVSFIWAIALRSEMSPTQDTDKDHCPGRR